MSWMMISFKKILSNLSENKNIFNVYPLQHSATISTSFLDNWHDDKNIKLNV